MTDSPGTAGRLAPIEAMVAAARLGAPDLGTLLGRAFPALATAAEEVARQRAFHGHASPSGLGAGGAAVWHDVALFAVASVRPPSLSLDGGDRRPMTAVAGTRYWTLLQPVTPGRLHRYRFGAGDEWAPVADVAGYVAESYEVPGSERGTLSAKRTVVSSIYPGATTTYWLYANPGVDQRHDAPLMVWHDGQLCLEPADLVLQRMQIVTDNLVHRGLIPPMVHVLVSPSTGGEGTASDARGPYAATMRGIQYDALSDRYGRHIMDEVLPHAGQVVKLRSDAYSRAVAGASSGALCAFAMAWFAPEQFARVHCVIGSFTAMQWDREKNLGGFLLPHLVRREPRRNVRVWLSDGANDLELDGTGPREVFVAGSWPLQNVTMANALKGSGYDFHFRFGDGVHGYGQAALDLPESLAWLWRGYDPDRTAEVFEQDELERARPMFRVRIANRESW